MRTIGRHVLVVAAVVGLLGACAPPSDDDRRAALVRDTVASISGYVDALRTGDLARADELRCAAARLRPEERELYLAPVVDEVARDLGGLEVDEVSLESSVDGVVHARVLLAGAAGAVHPALVREAGELRLCGSSIHGAAERIASLHTRDGTEDPPTRSLDDLAATPPIPGFSAAEDDGSADAILEQLDGFEGGRRLQWIDPTGRSIAVSIVDLDTADHARAAQQVLEAELHDVVTDLVTATEVPGLPSGTRGFRYLAGYQLLVQPPGAGPVGDYASLRSDRRVVSVYVVPLSAADDHALVTAALTAVVGSGGGLGGDAEAVGQV